jgi:hypothetical protein
MLASTAAAIPARADDPVPYDDRDSNYLMVLYHFVYPIGKLAEIVFFRPLHTIASFSQPDPRRSVTEGEDVTRCVSFRPSRSCSRGD